MSQSTTCRTCGASLQPDQRYCLSCGTRVTAPRLDFLSEMERIEAAGGSAPEGVPAAATGAAPATAVQPAVVAAPAPAASRLDKIGGPMGAAAVVLVALGVGFLIGRGSSEEPAAQRAPVVNIQGGLPAAGAATTPAPTDPAATAGGDTAAGGDSGAGDREASRRAAADDAARIAEETRNIPQSSGSSAGGDINRLRREPVQTATPGAPPPTDDEPSGGGSEGTSIG